MNSIREILADIISAEAPNADPDASPTASFADSGVDSLDMLAVVDAIENRFGFTFSDDDFGRLRNFADLETLVAERVGHVA